MIGGGALLSQLTPTPTLCFLGVVGSTRSGWLFRFIQLQANKLLHALPVLHLGGAVGVILT